MLCRYGFSVQDVVDCHIEWGGAEIIHGVQVHVPGFQLGEDIEVTVFEIGCKVRGVPSAVGGGAQVDIPVMQRPQDVETTAKGAAVLAALGSGQLADLQDAASAWQLDQTFTAQMPAETRQQLLDNYARAVTQALAG